MLRRSLLALAGVALLSVPASAQSPKALRVVMHSDLKIVDPVWTTAYIVRNHGYLIYDTLFAIDGKFEPQPQMVESWTVSDDKLIWTFKLRDGLKWHDGTPVTSADVVPSIKRWTDKDALGGLLAKSTKEMKAVDDRTFQIVLKEPFGMMTKALAKSASVPLFVMPKRVAETPVSQQISDTTGSGPFIFKKDEWKAGEKVVYVRNPDYKPRAEPPSGLAGGKVAKLDRIEWRSIPDPQTAVNALMSGEVDMIETVAHDLLPVLEKDKNVTIVVLDPLGLTYVLRYNWKHPPFNDVRYRRAATLSLNQKDFLQATIGDPRYYKECKAMFGCGTPLETSAGMQGLLESRFEESRKLLKELNYDGTPIVVLQTSDNPVLTNLAPVTKTLLERGGFKVDVQSMDWQTWWHAVPRRIPWRRAAGTSPRPRQRPCCCSIRSTTTMPRRAAIAPSSAGRSTRRSRSSACSSSARAIPRNSSRSPRRSRRASSAKASPSRSASSSNRWRGATR